MFGADENDGRLYLGVSSPPPLWFTEEQKRSLCINGMVPWIHMKCPLEYPRPRQYIETMIDGLI